MLIEFPVWVIDDGADSNFNMSMVILPVNTPGTQRGRVLRIPALLISISVLSLIT